MADEKEEKKDETPAQKAGEFKLKRAGEVVVNYQPEAVKAPEGKQIHPRRVLPLVPEAPSQENSTDKEQEKE